MVALYSEKEDPNLNRTFGARNETRLVWLELTLDVLYLFDDDDNLLDEDYRHQTKYRSQASRFS